MKWRLWRRAVGIEFTRTGCRCVAVRFGSRGPEVLGAVKGELADGHELQATDACVSQLRDFARRHRLRNSRVVIGVPSERVTVRLLKMPPLPDRALRQAVALELGETIHLPFDDPVFDVVRVPQLVANDAGEEEPVCLVAAPRAYVQWALQVVRSAGLRPRAVDLAPLARLRAAGPDAWQAAGVRVLLQLDDADTTISVIVGGALYFLRTVENLSNGVDEGTVVDGRLADVAYEVDRVIKFFQFNLAGRELPVEGVWLAGLLSDEAVTAARLSGLLGLPVQPLPAEVVWRRGAAVNHSAAYATAVGLALKGGFP
ncbi:MAG: pilus assembly protein PilM [Alicyclobacillus macrosporangiidus]|uniref:type IV pilus biogenesis protein PilM n=1 Tax=Alicyclobacillus macrosporangiidus TaxID=392015 RepID=UPI0026EFB6E4|nr:pilus assembly protein PilM [Alicyclobacillus macrosporangiidus]MCL6598568.1 pilus assembly protein PilM [Alicyclobacillus macrosporangiidus]